MDYFEKNLKLLQAHDPALAERVKSQSISENVVVNLSKEGLPVPQIAGVSLHSQYHPLKEAERITRDFQHCENSRTVVFGLGFGYHVMALPVNTEITVIEPLLSLFRVFLSSMDLTPFIPRVRFRIAETPASLLARYEPEKWSIFRHTPSIRIGESYYQQLEKGIEIRDFISRQSLKVLVVKPIYGGSLPTANYCVASLKNMGHEVETVDCDKFADGFFSMKDATKIKANAEVLSQKFLNLMGEVTAAKAVDFRPDIILALAQAPLTPEAVNRLKELDIPIVFWFVEDFRVLPYWKEVSSAYDHFFSLQKEGFFPELMASGAKDCYYLPQGCYPAVHRPLDLAHEQKEIYETDVSFMGAAYHNRVQSFPRLMDLDFKIWGTGWDLGSSLGRRVQNNNERVTTEETVSIYNAAKINLNLHSSTYHYGVNPDGDFVNPRTFEIAACKGFQLLDNRSDLINLFKISEELVVFENLDDLKSQIDFYLSNSDLRNELACRSYQRVLSEHTIEHRMQELLIHVFINRPLKKNKEEGEDPIAYCIDKAGENTNLGRYLDEFNGTQNFSLNTLVSHIQDGEGDLDDNETLIMMLDQLIQEKD